MPIEQIKLVDIGFGVAPLLVDQVDAMMGFSMNEADRSRERRHGRVVMPISDFGVDVYGLTIVSNNTLIAEEAGPGRRHSCARPARASRTQSRIRPRLSLRWQRRSMKSTPPGKPRCWTARSRIWQSEETRSTVPVGRRRSAGRVPSMSARKLGLIETDLKPDQVFINAFLAAK